jgi:hypothetical protein
MLAAGAAVALVLGAVLDVPAGAPLAPALAAARPGDVVRLGPGRHAGALGSPAGVRIEGAGAGATTVVVPEGEDGAIARGPLALAGLSLRAGPARCGLKVFAGGDATLDDVALSGGSCGAFVDGGRLAARDVALAGGYGLLLRSGEARIDRGSARGSSAGIAVLAGAATLRRFAVTGPSAEAGVTVAGGTASLEGVVIRAPGPTGLAVSHGGRVEAVDVTVAGAVDEGGFLGACVQVLRGSVRLTGATLVGCAGAAVEAAGGEVVLDGVDATGGAAGCIVLVDGAAGALAGTWCGGRGPGLVVEGRSRARLVANRWRSAPFAWVDCAGGARVEVGRGEQLAPPCAGLP